MEDVKSKSFEEWWDEHTTSMMNDPRPKFEFDRHDAKSAWNAALASRPVRLPERKETTGVMTIRVRDFNNGFNKCLDEITSLNAQVCEGKEV